MRRSRRMGALSAATLMLTALVVFAAPAQAEHVGCGDTITTDTTLDGDIGPCPGTGLTVTASGITLDLNGFRIFADNGPGDNMGIRLRGVHGVTVTNGTVEGFDAGIVIQGGGTNTVEEMVAQNNVNDLQGSPCELGDGIALFGSDNNVIHQNLVAGNGPFGGVTVVGNADGNVIADNQVRDNNIPGPGCGNANQDEGIRIEGPGATDNRVENNVVERSLLAGIGLHGYRCNPPAGQPEEPNTGTVVVGNTVRDSAGSSISSGVNFLQQGPATIVCPSFANTVEDNTSTGNQGDGVFVAANSHDNAINRNSVGRNGRDGIHLNGPRFGTNFTNVGPTLFDVVSPDLPPYAEGTDFKVMFGSGSGDVTGELVAIDLAIPDDGPVNSNPVDTSTSGCEASDFTDAGFQPGDVALIQRGTCTFVTKVDNAIAAGASAVIMFNEGQTGRTSADFGSINPVDIPVLSATYAVGQQLNDLTVAGTVTVHVVTNTTAEVVQTAPGAYDNTLTGNRGARNGAFDGFDGNLDPPCDNNQWLANRFRTVNQPCVAANGGTGVMPAAPAARQAAASTTSAGEGDTVQGLGRDAASGAASATS